MRRNCVGFSLKVWEVVLISLCVLVLTQSEYRRYYIWRDAGASVTRKSSFKCAHFVNQHSETTGRQSAHE